MAATIEVYGPATPGSRNERGPCPFTQGVLMALEERDLLYNDSYIDPNNKPDWFTKNNLSGTLPAIKNSDTWVAGFDEILEHLNSKYPEQSEPLQVPSSLQPQILISIIEWMESKNKFSEAALGYRQAVRDLNNHLEGKRIYMAGSHVTDADCSVFPKIRHARTALLHFMDFEIPLEYASVHSYIELMSNRESCRRTDTSDLVIISGYEKMFNMKEAVGQTY